MPQPPPEPSQNLETLGIWAGVLLSGLLASAAAFRVFFGLVSRSELKEALEEEREAWKEALKTDREAWAKQLEAQRVAFAERDQRNCDDRDRMHSENRDTAKQTFERLAAVEQGVARIEGTLSGRYPGIQR